MEEGSRSDAQMNKLDMVEADDEEDFFTSYDDDDVYDSFDAMGLHENLLKAIYAYVEQIPKNGLVYDILMFSIEGLEKPSPIQQRCIVPFRKGLDIYQQAQSEQDKTLILCCGILQQLDYSVRQCQALVMVPKGQHALQIVKALEALGEDFGVKVCVSLGGNKPAGLVQTLADGVHVVVGTPGGVCGLLRRQLVRSDCIGMLVLDGVDEILERGFKDQIHEMFQSLPTKIQVGMFSATITSDLLEIINKYMDKPLRILVNRDVHRQNS